MRLRDFTNAEQTEWTGINMPEVAKEIVWDSNEALVLVDEDDIPPLWIFPQFLKRNAHVSFTLVCHFVLSSHRTSFRMSSSGTA